MRKKILAILLAVSMLSASGCTKEKLALSSEAAPGAENGFTDGKETAAEKNMEDTAGTDTVSVGGGSPWIDSDLKENITESMALSEKDDCHLYVRYL